MRSAASIALVAVLAVEPAHAAWEKLYYALGNDNKWAAIAAAPGGSPIIVVGQASDGQGNTTPAAKYSANGTDFSNASTGTSGMAMMLGATAAGSNLLVTRTTFTMALPPTVASELLRSTGSNSFTPIVSVADATFLDVAGATNGFVVVIGSLGDEPAAWVSTDSGQTLTAVGLPAAGDHVNPVRVVLLGNGCAVVVGGDPGETDSEGTVIRPEGLGAVWVRLGSGDFVLKSQAMAASLYAVDFPTPSIGYVGGSGNGIAYLGRTENGGASFTGQALPSHASNGTPTSVTGIHCFEASRCIAMVGFGSDGQVGPSLPIYTTDSGETWQYDDTMTQPLGNMFERASGLLAMSFVSAELGLFAGENHLVMRYTAPGASPEVRVPCGGGSDAGGVPLDAAGRDARLGDGGLADVRYGRADTGTTDDVVQPTCSCTHATPATFAVSALVLALAGAWRRRL